MSAGLLGSAKSSKPENFPKAGKNKNKISSTDKMVLIEVKTKHCICCFSEISGKRKRKQKSSIYEHWVSTLFAQP